MEVVVGHFQVWQVCAGSRDKMNDPVWNIGTYAYAYEPIPQPSDQWP